MQTDPMLEWRRLTDYYRELSDEQLQELAADFADLTEVAQQVFQSEMRSRGLPPPQAPGAAEKSAAGASTATGIAQTGSRNGRQVAPLSEADDALATDGPREYTWKTLLCECNDREQAWQLCEMLRRAGVDSWIEGPGLYSPHAEMDVTNPRVLVAADQLDQARMVAASPIPQEVVDESRMTMPEFVTPTCPGCGAADPALEGVKLVNSWRCEVCGRRWTDPTGGSQETGP
jgi:ribosomal protein S27E